jgi:hypothetical protein
MKKLNLLFVALACVALTAFGEHNQPAPNKGKNLTDERIYGEIGEKTPRQLKKEWDSPDGIAERMDKIRNKLYPN